MMKLMEMLQPVKSTKVKTKKPVRKKTAKTPEGKVKEQVKFIFDTYRVYWFMPVTGGYNRSGVPDFIACCNGKFIAVETKSKYTRHGVTALQAQNIQQIIECNGVALVIDEDNIDELEQLIKNILAYNGAEHA